MLILTLTPTPTRTLTPNPTQPKSQPLTLPRSELRAVRAPPPAPRPIEWHTSDAPDDVDRDYIVYVSRAKYHHRKCQVVRTWHHRAYGGTGTTMRKASHPNPNPIPNPIPIPNLDPDPDPNHAEGPLRGDRASSRRQAVLEVLSPNLDHIWLQPRSHVVAGAPTASASSSTCSQGAGCARRLSTVRLRTRATTRARAPHGWSRSSSQMATQGSQAS